MMIKSQVTVPRYRENSLLMPFSMLCHGISQNSKHHHLILYNGQVWKEKSYLELCNHNFVNIVYRQNALLPGDVLEQSGQLNVPPVPGYGFKNDMALIPWDSEILQSFADLANITYITFQQFDYTGNYFGYQIIVGSHLCDILMLFHNELCLPPQSYRPWYILTKVGLKNKYKILNYYFPKFNFLNLSPSIHHKDPE